MEGEKRIGWEGQGEVEEGERGGISITYSDCTNWKLPCRYPLAQKGFFDTTFHIAKHLFETNAKTAMQSVMNVLETSSLLSPCFISPLHHEKTGSGDGNLLC